MAGSVAAAGASATSATIAGTVQFTLQNNQVTVTANNLKADVTGDGVDDLQGLGTFSFTTTTSSPGNSFFRTFVMSAYFAGGRLGRVFGRFRTFSSTSSFTRFSATAGTLSNTGLAPQTARAFVPVTFTDGRVNGEAPTKGLLEVLSFNTSFSPQNHTIRLVRLVFDDATTVGPSGAVPGGFNPEFDPSVYTIRAAAAANAAASAAAAKARQFSLLSKKINKTKAAQRKARRAGKIAEAVRLQRVISKYQRQLRALV